MAGLAERDQLVLHVTAHTLRHTAATWLRQELGDTRLVAGYLGHADLSNVAHYAHVDCEELFEAAGRLEQLAAPSEERGGRACRRNPEARRSTRRVGSAAPSTPPKATET